MKYLWCFLVIALATQASAQLRCIQCTNCASLPATPTVVTCAHPPTLPPGQTTTTPISTTISTSPTPPGDQRPTLTPSPQPIPPTTTTLPSGPVTPPAGPSLTPATDAPSTEPTTAPPVTNATTIAPPTTLDPNVPTFTPASHKVRRSIEDINEFAAHFSCFRVRVPVGNNTQINRGCVANAGSNNRTCWLTTNDLVEPQDCQLCSGNECNSSNGLISSLFLVITSIFIALRML